MKDKKKILIISAVFYPEPVVSANLSRDLALHLSENHKVTVLCPKPTRPYQYDFSNISNYNIDNGYKKIILKSYTCAKTSYLGRMLESYSFGKAVSNFLLKNRNEFDVIYSWSWPLYSQLYIAKIAHKLEIPLITHVQDVYPEPFLRRIPYLGKLLYRLFFCVDKKSLQLSNKVIAIAPKIKEYLVNTRKLDSNKVEVVYNWQDERRFEKAYHSNEIRPFTFMFLGTLSGAANLEYIASSFLEANIPNSRFIFAGSGSVQSKLKIIADSDSSKRIKFVEASFSDVAKIQAQADVLVVSLNKGGGAHAFPSKLPAYMFSKKPILASVDITSDIAYIINQADCGWVVEPNNSMNLIKLMQTIATIQKNKLDKKGCNGYKYCIDNLSRTVNLKKICELIESL